MTPSEKTLGNMIDRLPANARMRYDVSFFVDAANEILQEFETASDADYLRDEAALTLREDVTEYVLPNRVRRILGLFLVERPCMPSTTCNTSSTFSLLGYEAWSAQETYTMNRQVTYLGNIAVSRTNGNLNHEPPPNPGTFEADGAAYTYWNVFANLEEYNRYIADLLS